MFLKKFRTDGLYKPVTNFLKDKKNTESPVMKIRGCKMCIRDSAYTVEIYDAEGGKLLETYGLRFDTSKIVTQKGVESIVIDETEIVF